MITRILCVFLCAVLFASYAGAEQISVVSANFPCFDFVRSIGGERVHAAMLLPAGSESHTYEPTPQDIITIQNSDLFVYVGGESDQWIETVLFSMGSDAPETLRLSDSVTMLASGTTMSMEHSHAHEHDEQGNCSDPAHIHVDGHHHEMDEHVWTSPKNAILIAESLKNKLISIDPAGKTEYAANHSDFHAELLALDQAFEQIVQQGKRDILIFGDRFPFRYFADAYGLRYDAAFPGCSEDSEPSIRTVISLIDTVREQQIPVVFHIEFSSRRTADILSEETGAAVRLFHSCHNVSADEIAAGATYLSLMWRNSEVLKEALN